MRKIKEKMHRWLKEAISFNYVYFGFLLICLLSFTCLHFFTLQTGFHFSSLYFFFYAIGETLVEVSFFLFTLYLLKTHSPKWIYYLFVSITFSFVLLHFIDLMLIKSLDISVWDGIMIAFDETWENFIEMLQLTGISLTVWVVGFILAIIGIPMIGIIFYLLTKKISEKYPLQMPRRTMVKGAIFFPTFLLFLDLSFSPVIDKVDYLSFQRSLPWKGTFLSYQKDQIDFSSPIRKIPSEDNWKTLSQNLNYEQQKRPNLVLFIVESLRRDFLTKEVCPSIAQFAKTNVSFPITIANANATHKTWYSLFHANFPFYWAEQKRSGWTSGSIPLNLLKKMGYHIHLYSAAQLKYYGIQELIFGKENYLIDHAHIFTHYQPKQAWEADQEAVDTLIADLQKPGMDHNQVFLVFLDSTHFNYSWPEDFPTKFEPICSEKTQLRVSNTYEDIEKIKNRYRNAIAYVDTLFHKAVKTMKKRECYDSSFVVFTGDHGEEFLEKGQLFHASHLSRMQIDAPIYYKFPDQKQLPQNVSAISTHMDIFPTILEQIDKEKFHIYERYMQGQSLYKKNRRTFAISARYNASRTPHEFSIHNGTTKVVAKLLNYEDLSKPLSIEILKIQDFDDHIMTFTPEEGMSCREFVKETFGSALNSIIESPSSF